MNIFAVAKDPVIAAGSLCDKHVVKMILESAQMLCTAHFVVDRRQLRLKPTHKNHPCVRWVCASSSNYSWLARHALALAEEYWYRYRRLHAYESTGLLNYLYDIRPRRLDILPMTPFAQCMPDEYKHSSAVAAYRRYYLGEKARFAVYTRRPPPKWFPHATFKLIGDKK